MPNDTIARRTVSVSRHTGIAVRGPLARGGVKKGDLSRFVEEEVEWRAGAQTMAKARGKSADMSSKALESAIGEAVQAGRRQVLNGRYSAGIHIISK